MTDASGKVSLIGVQELLRMQQAQGQTQAAPAMQAAAPAEKSRLPLIFGLAGGAALLVAAIVGLLMAGGPDKALEREARRELLAITALEREGKLDNALSRAKLGMEDYAETSLAEDYANEVASLRKQITEKKRDEDFRHAIAKADEAEKTGDLEGAIVHLTAALELRTEDDVNKRITSLRNILETRTLLERGRAMETSKEYKDALQAYEAAVKIATGENLKKAVDGAGRMKTQIGIEKTIAGIDKLVAAKQWRRVWDETKEAMASGISDERLTRFRTTAAAGLVPPRTMKGPLDVDLVLMPMGTFAMGSDHEKDEKPIREVTVSAFYMGKYEITRAQYEAYKRKLKALPTELDAGATEPVTKVSYADATDFAAYLSSLSKPGATYRLPTEAEWEYAARGTEGRVYPWGSEKPTVEHANLHGVGDGFLRTAPVGHFEKGQTPNGIFDMTGNVAEW
jgi:formylglycine-generating enzyme required for sulfatase activity